MNDVQTTMGRADVQARELAVAGENDNFPARSPRPWSLARLASMHLPAQDLDALDGEDERTYRRRVARIRKQAGFAQARAGHIAALLRHRHGGPCDTDDAMVWAAAALPYVVEGAVLLERSPYASGLRWVMKHCPGLRPDHQHLDQVAGVISGLLLDREDALQDAKGHGKNHPEWLPTMADLVRDLRPTWAEVTGLDLRGWGSIDRPADDALKVRKVDLQRERRRAQGVKPMSERTRTADLKVLAAEIDVDVRTIQRWEKKGTTAAEISKRRDVANLKHRKDFNIGSFTFATRPDPANDDEMRADAA